ARDVLLAEHVGSRVHICHLSTAGSVEIVRWANPDRLPGMFSILLRERFVCESNAASNRWP
ncbi:hypothetical protein ACWC4E_32955, partial [Streptomyces sp. NPDC001273]